MGPTASGKTALAEALAQDFDAQLVNADAFQAYRGMDIGTAKPEDRDRYRLLDIKEPNESYGVGEFCMLAQAELNRLFAEGRSAIVVGGTGLYIRALFEEYRDMQVEPDPALRVALNRRLADEGLEALYAQLTARNPEAAQLVDPQNPIRVIRALERVLDPRERIAVHLPPFNKFKFAVDCAPDVLKQRIEERAHLMVHNGWTQEVVRLRSLGYGPGDPGFQAIGYRAMSDVVEGKSELEEAIATTIAESRRYAKRQRTWLRSEPEVRHLASGTQGHAESRKLIDRTLQ